MRTVHGVIGLLIASACATNAWGAQAQDNPTNVMPGAAEAGQCAQAQPVVDKLLEAANARLENARQSNSPAAMRAAVDDLQRALRDVRVQLAPCANVAALAGPHAGHAMPGMTGSAPMTPGMPMPPGSTSPAAAGRPPAAPAAADPHAGHTMPAPAKPVATKPATRAAKPAATPKAAAPDPHAGHGAAAATPTAEGGAVDPVCGLTVDPNTAPQAKHQGQTYHFCSEQHQQLFTKSPAKYVPKRR